MKLLLAVDQSESSDIAVRELTRRPWPADLHVRVLSVVAQDVAEAPEHIPVPSEPLGEADRDPWPGGTLATRRVLDKDALAIAQRAVAELQKHGIAAEPFVREGSPGREIVAAAREWRATLIVLGSHGHGRVKRMLLGSVANHVLNHAPCSVEVVREAHYD